MLPRLPPSLDATQHSVWDEVAFARSLTPEQRLEVLARVCAVSARQLRDHPMREQVLAARESERDAGRAVWRRLSGRT